MLVITIKRAFFHQVADHLYALGLEDYEADSQGGTLIGYLPARQGYKIYSIKGVTRVERLSVARPLCGRMAEISVRVEALTKKNF
jgi:hypothetical protein